jgi:hypothetical protein
MYYVLASGMKKREIERKLKLISCIVYVILQITGCDKIDNEGFVVVENFVLPGMLIDRLQ